MTKQDYITYIQTRLYTRANQLYDDPRLATQYIIGFLTQQLGEAMYRDSLVAERFKHTVQKDLD